MGNGGSKAAACSWDPTWNHNIDIWASTSEEDAQDDPAINEIAQDGQRVPRRIEDVEAEMVVHEITADGRRVARSAHDIQRINDNYLYLHGHDLTIFRWMDSLEEASEGSIKGPADSVLDWETVSEVIEEEDDEFAEEEEVYQYACIGEYYTPSEEEASEAEEHDIVVELPFQVPEWAIEMEKFQHRVRLENHYRYLEKTAFVAETLNPFIYSRHSQEKIPSLDSRVSSVDEQENLTYNLSLPSIEPEESRLEHQPLLSGDAANDTKDSSHKKRSSKSNSVKTYESENAPNNTKAAKHESRFFKLTSAKTNESESPPKPARFKSMPNLESLKASISNMSLFSRARGLKRTASCARKKKDNSRTDEPAEPMDFGLPPIPSLSLGRNFPYISSMLALMEQEEIEESRIVGEKKANGEDVAGTKGPVVGHVLSPNVKRRTFAPMHLDPELTPQVMDSGFAPYNTMSRRLTSMNPMDPADETQRSTARKSSETQRGGESAGIEMVGVEICGTIQNGVLTERLVQWRERVGREQEFVVITIADN